DVPLKQLSDIGQRFLKQPQSSQTAERLALWGLMSHAIPATVGAALGAGGSALGGDDPLAGAVKGGMFGVGLPLAARGLSAASLRNQALGRSAIGSALNPAATGPIASMMQSPGALSLGGLMGRNLGILNMDPTSQKILALSEPPPVT